MQEQDDTDGNVMIMIGILLHSVKLAAFAASVSQSATHPSTHRNRIN